MARRRRNRYNWLQFFQSLESTWGKVAIVATIFGVGYGVGYYSSEVVKNRELLQKEREFSDLATAHNKEINDYEKLQMDVHLENNQLKSQLYIIKDSIRRNEKK